MSTPAGPNFTKWPDPESGDYDLWINPDLVFGAGLHWLNLQRNANFAGVIAALHKFTEAEYNLLGRVVVMPDGLAVESHGQWIGRIEARQSKSWSDRIQAAGGWVWGTFTILEEDDGTLAVRDIGINKSKL